MLIAEFDIMVDYIEGKANKVADHLSRLRKQEENDIDEYIESITEDEEENIVEWNLQELIRLQDEHAFYKIVKRLLQEKFTEEEIKKELSKHNIDKRYKKLKIKELSLENNILYRVTYNAYGELTRQIIIPESYVKPALHLGHSLPTEGHGGEQVTLNRCQRFAYWPKMKEDVHNYCKSCTICARLKRKGDAPAPLRRYPDVERPFQRIHMDIIGPLGKSERGYMYCLVIIDVLTRYLVAEPLRTKTATEVARVFFASVICKYGIPQILVTDQGREFVNAVLQGIAELLKFTHIKTTAYHPQANGVIERSNATLINILRTLVRDNIDIWDTMLPIATFAYNSAYHKSIKESPFFLMYLRDPPFPFDDIEEEKVWYNVDDYKQEMATKANRVYARCQQYLEEAKGVNEKAQAKKAKVKLIQVGDRVYVRRVPSAGTPSKLQPAYIGPFRVIDKVSDVVVKVRNIRTGAVKTLHTDRVRVIHEDNASPHINPNVRRAYPIHETGETKETKVTLQTLDPFPFMSEDTDDRVNHDTDDNSTSEENHNVSNEIDDAVEEAQNESQDEASTSSHPTYSLRSRSVVPDLPLIMNKPLEYCK